MIDVKHESSDEKIPKESEYLEFCLWHSKADRSLRLIIARELEQFNITMMEWLLIAVVDEQGKQGASMSYIANKLDVTLPQVTALSINLTKTKLLKQKISHKDRRSRKLICTPGAKKIFQDGQKSINTALNTLFSQLSHKEIAGYLDTMKLIANSKPTGPGVKLNRN